MTLKKIFRPTKEKIIADFALCLIFLSMYFLTTTMAAETLLKMSLLMQLLVIAANLLLSVVIYYPLACALVFAYRNVSGKTKGKEKPVRRDFAAAVLAMIFLNPVSLGLILSGLLYMNNNVINQPCGLEIAGFSEFSPAKNAGVSAGEVIIAADGSRVDTRDSLYSVLSKKKPGDPVSITTDRKSYDIITAEEQNTHRAVIGVSISDKYCRR